MSKWIVDKSAMMYDIYMEGVNMGGEYQGCWVRFTNIEKIIDRYIGSEESEEYKGPNADDILKIISDNCSHRFGCACCIYRNNDTNRCRLAGVPCEWGLEE